MTFAAQKLLKITAASLLIAGLAACGGGGSNPPATDPTPTGTTPTDTSTGGTTSGGTATGVTPSSGTTTTAATTTSTTTVTTTPTGTVTGGATTTSTTTVTSTTTGTVTGGVSGTPTTVVTILPLTALQVATAYLASVDALVATAVPATGEANAATLDGCFLGGGRTKANAISSYNADLTNSIASNAFRIGSTRINPVVTGERNTTNTDGSARREIDVQYAVNYTDGSKDNVVNLTLITGSSFGTCATAQNSPDTRSFGDRQLVNIDLRAETTRTDQFELRTTTRVVTAGATSPYPTYIGTLASGTTATFAVVPAGERKVVPLLYERQANFRIVDPMNNATYVVITGPGFLTVSGVQAPWSLKMLSPRLLKNDSTFANKLGNYTSITDESTFALCRVGSNGGSPGTAALADCAGSGATGTKWGVSMVLPVSPGTLDASAADARLAQVGIVTGTYTFAIYNDDGWKTPNGQAVKTPIATYTAQLESLPVSFVDMNVTNDPSSDKFAKVLGNSGNSGSPQQFVANTLGGRGFSGELSWIAPQLSATSPFKLSFVEAYAEGPISTVIGSYPRVAFLKDIYPGGNATTGQLSIGADPSNLGIKTFASIQVNYTNRNQSRIRSQISFN